MRTFLASCLSLAVSATRSATRLRQLGLMALVSLLPLQAVVACSNDAPDNAGDGQTGGATNAAAGTSAESGKSQGTGPSRGALDPNVTEPAWFADCDIGPIAGACDYIGIDAMHSGTTCLEWAEGKLDLSGSCGGAQYVIASGRCDPTDAVAICVSTYGRVMYYDAAQAQNLESACQKVCRAEASGDGDGSCDRFLRCVCGSVSPQPDDSPDCRDARSIVASYRTNYGQQAADAYCSNLLDLAPATDGCGGGGAGGAAAGGSGGAP